MLSLLPLFCVAIATVSGAATHTRWTANYNNDFDEILRYTKQYASVLQLDPMKLPDINRTVSVNILLQVITGGVVNTNGILTGGKTIQRSGDVIARNDGATVYIDADISFANLNYVYTTRAEIASMGAGGQTTGEINNLVLHLALKTEATTPDHIELVDLVVKNTGEITVHFDNGMAILDQFFDTFSDVIIVAFKQIITANITPEIEKAVKYAIDKIEGNSLL